MRAWRATLVLAGVCSLALASPAPAASPPRGFEKSFDYDRGVPLSPTARPEGQTDVSRIEKVTFRAADGQRVPALLVLPRRGRQPRPCVLGAHYYTGTKEDIVNEKGDFYAARGVALFAIDARYHGERPAGLGPEGAATRLDALHRLFRLTVIDLRRGIDYLVRRRVCAPGRIAVEGRSLGGFLGAMLIGADRRVKAAALYVSGADWRSYFANSSVFIGAPLRGARLNRAVRKLNALDPKWWIARARGRPVFMAAGRRDDIMPLVAARALHRAARNPKQVIVFDGGHDLEEPHGTRVYRAAAAFLGRHLRFRGG